MLEPVITKTAAELVGKLIFEKAWSALDKGYSPKERFINVYTPLYDSMVSIHTDYTKMFKKVLALLPIPQDDGLLTCVRFNRLLEILDEDRDVKKESDIYKNNLKNIENILEVDRVATGGLRDQAKNNSRLIVERIDKKDEKDFAVSVINYFIYDPRNIYDGWDTWEFLTEKVLDGTETGKLNSPSDLVQKSFKELDYNVDEIKKYLIGILGNLNTKYLDVTYTHNILLKKFLV